MREWNLDFERTRNGANAHASKNLESSVSMTHILYEMYKDDDERRKFYGRKLNFLLNKAFEKGYTSYRHSV